MNVLILVCALAVSAPDCQKETSIHSFYAPDAQADMSGCFRHGMLFAAESNLVGPANYAKVVCVPANRKLARTER